MQTCQVVLVGVEVEDAVGVERNASQIEGKIGARRGNLLLQRIERFLARVGAKPLKSHSVSMRFPRGRCWLVWSVLTMPGPTHSTLPNLSAGIGSRKMDRSPKLH
jgi:hypothetical protein